jgi:hypothetical protein
LTPQAGEKKLTAATAQLGTQRQQSGGVSAGCWPSGQAAQRTFEQSRTVSSIGTQRQQLGGVRAGVCPAGQALHRTVEQSTSFIPPLSSMSPVLSTVAVVPPEVLAVALVSAPAGWVEEVFVLQAQSATNPAATIQCFRLFMGKASFRWSAILQTVIQPRVGESTSPPP